MSTTFVWHTVEHWVREAPSHPAVVTACSSTTYADLARTSAALSARLVEHSAGAGDRIAFFLPNGSGFVAAFLSIMRIGGVAVPLNVNYQQEELKYYVRSSGARLIITDSARLSKLNAMLGQLEERPRIVLIEEAAGTPAQSLPAVPVSPDQPAIHQYSTGSTGQPKPVIRTQGQLMAEVRHYGAAVRIVPSDRILTVVPMFHSHGFGNCLLAALMNGTTMVILESFNPREVLSVLESERITIYPGVPFMFKMLNETMLKSAPDLSSLRLCFWAGGALDPAVSHAFHKRFGQHIRQLYGTTETGSITINLGDDIETSLESVGVAMPGIKLTVAGESGETLPAGEVGEIGISSPAMTRGYEGLADVTKASFRNGYFFPGDVGRIDEQGRVFVTGRKTFFINVGGSKVDPAEVERIIGAHPKVSEVVVLGVKTPYGGEIVKAVVVPREQCEVAEILEACHGKLAEYKLPKIVEFRAEIPRSPLGKFLRKYLVDSLN